ncbi:hypothetical protein KIW84_025369 [Lathyrus oleraceus]|uniref:Uncharacterized protein n=1 Tax=Pisum sativum TaxID=3888 RepID=A0A9D4YI19_PEA|nr:hypothetical protein KIW84_025369 [Pisum sativum]
MAFEFPQKCFSDKQHGKRPMTFSSLPPVHKKAGTKVQARKVTPNARIKKKLSKNQIVEALCPKFKDKVIKFNYMEFKKYFGLTFGGSDMDVGRSSDYDRISFILSISKSVCENPAMSNFGISKVKFDMRLLHWIIVKILYRKPTNWGIVDDNDLYLTWELITDSGLNWVKFIINRMLYCRFLIFVILILM